LIDTAVAIVGLVPACAGALGPLNDFMSARRARSGLDGSNTRNPGIHELTTPQPPEPTATEVRGYKLGGLLVGLLATGYFVFGAYTLTDERTWSRVIGVVLVCQSVYFATFAGQRLKLKGSSPYLCETKVDLEIVSESSPAQELFAVIAALGAVRASGSYLRSNGTHAAMQGGFAGWPAQSRGVRLRAEVVQGEPGRWHVSINAASLWPAPFEQRRNERIARKVLLALIATGGSRERG
jgi:hypothetical protein